MKILIDDKMQISDAPDEWKSPSLADTSLVTSKDLTLTEQSEINCIGIGNTDATEVLINSRSAFIGQEYTNLVTDPTELDLWTTHTSTTVTDSGQTINGYKLWSANSTGGLSYRYILSTQFVCASTDIVYRGIARKTTSDLSILQLRNITTVTASGSINITFSTKTLTPVIGTILDYTWLDDDTVEIIALADSTTITVGNSLQARLYGNGATADSTSTLWTMPQVTESTTMFPFVDGTHAADVINETFTMPDKFAIDMIIDPKFAYDVSSQQTFFTFRIDTTHRLYGYYNNTDDTIRVLWGDGSTVAFISQVFDDGTSYTNINQRIRIICFLDLTSGIQSGSSQITIPQESGSISIDNLWSGSPNIKTSTFPTLSIGHNAGANQADSDIEYLRIYDWDGVKPTITNSSDATNYFANETLLFEWRGFPLINGGIYPETITLASTEKNGLYPITNAMNTTEVTVSHNGTYMGRLALGESRDLYPSPAREPGFYTTQKPRLTASGQVVEGAGGVSGRELNLDFRYKFTLDIFNDIESAFAEQLAKGYPFFLYFDKETQWISWLRMYGQDTNRMLFQSSVNRFLYSKRMKLIERF